MQGIVMHQAQVVDLIFGVDENTENKDLRLLGARISHSQAEEIKFRKR